MSFSLSKVEAAGVFTWEELSKSPVDAVVVRAITESGAPAAVAPLGMPADLTGNIEGALSQLEALKPDMLHW